MYVLLFSLIVILTAIGKFFTKKVKKILILVLSIFEKFDMVQILFLTRNSSCVCAFLCPNGDFNIQNFLVSEGKLAVLKTQFL